MSNPFDPHLYALVTNQKLAQRVLLATGGEVQLAPTPMQRGRDVYFGPVANHCITHTQVANAGLLSFMNQSFHYARDNITAIQVVWANWHVQTGVETGTGGLVQITASIEYPYGTFQQLTFNGGATFLSIPNLTNGFSDIITLQNPIPMGQRFRIRCFWVPLSGSTALPLTIGNASQVVTSGIAAQNLGDAQEQTAVDKTMNGQVITDRGFNSGTKPLAILGYTSKPSIAFLGDSRQIGPGESQPDASGDVGEHPRQWNGLFGAVNCGAPSESVQSFLNIANSANRRQIAAFASMIVCNYGINDVANLRTAAQILTDLGSLAALFPGVPFLPSTVVVRSTSTDNWATTVNQTVDPNNAQRVALNAGIRVGNIVAPNLLGYIELADVCESFRDSGLWAVTGLTGNNAYTTDGVHETSLANRKIAASCVWPVNALRQGL